MPGLALSCRCAAPQLALVACGRLAYPAVKTRLGSRKLLTGQFLSGFQALEARHDKRFRVLVGALQLFRDA